MNINEELKQLRILTIENNSVNISKEDLIIEIERIKVKNEMLKEENNKYKKHKCMIVCIYTYFYKTYCKENIS